MARGPTLLLALALAFGGAGFAAAEPHGDGTNYALQREMDRLYALRTSDPQAFVAQARSLESLPAPTNLAQRESLQFLRANRAALEGRFAEAIALARPLAESAEDPGLRLRAGGFVVNMLGIVREFESGLRLLRQLLEAHKKIDGPLREDVLGLWGIAAVFYSELGEPSLSGRYAQMLLDQHPSERLACFAIHFLVLARMAAEDPSISKADFETVHARCEAADEAAVIGGLSTLAHIRFLRERKRTDDALRLLESRLGAIDSTRYPRLTSEAYALDAELLLEVGRVELAERQARHALVLAKDAPTSTPVAMAEKVLFEIARRRGEHAAALGHLQRHVAAKRALAEEDRLKELAFRTVQHENLQREQALKLMTERHRVLDLEAQVAKAESRNAFLAASLLLLALLGAAAWGWRLMRQERRYRALARTDGLTGFANRLHFAEQAEAALQRSREAARPLMLISFDLDHFKRINDRHGHLAGDAVLRAVSEAIRQQPAAGLPRLVGRIGGEEFAVLLEGASLAQALAHAEDLRLAIAEARAHTDAGATLAVTASFGVTGTHESGHALPALMACSDRALYRAKHDGRDRVCVPEPRAALEAA